MLHRIAGASLLCGVAACGVAPHAPTPTVNMAPPPAATREPSPAPASAELAPTPSPPAADPGSVELPDAVSLAPAPVPVTERLLPCRVELTHTFRDVDVSDDAWKAERRGVQRLVRRWDSERWEVSWDKNPIAPIPLTLAQARASLPMAEDSDLTQSDPKGREGETAWVIASLRDESFSYAFDAAGRTIKVDWDPVADSSAYVFRYEYACRPSSARHRPYYADDAPPAQGAGAD